MFLDKSSFIFIILFLLISPVQAHVNLLNPNGGETFNPGQLINIEWEEVLRHDLLNWDVLFSSDGGVSWDTVKSNIPKSTMNYSWELPDISTQSGRIKIVQDNVEVDYEDVSDDFIISSVTGIYQPIESDIIKMYPIPVSGFTYIEFDNPENNPYTLTIYNSKGQILRLLKEIKTNRIRLDLMDLSRGIYFYQLNSITKLHSTGNFLVR